MSKTDEIRETGARRAPYNTNFVDREDCYRNMTQFRQELAQVAAQLGLMDEKRETARLEADNKAQALDLAIRELRAEVSDDLSKMAQDIQAIRYRLVGNGDMKGSLTYVTLETARLVTEHLDRHDKHEGRLWDSVIKPVIDWVVRIVLLGGIIYLIQQLN